MKEAISRLRVIVSMHDATPFHLQRLIRAERFFQEVGVTKLTYLLVPKYHGSYLSSENQEFIDWCKKSRSIQLQWHLHGYHHLEQVSDLTETENGKSKSDGWKRKYLTAGEGEFLSLNAEVIRKKIIQGQDVFQKCLGFQPIGFVAPAWLFNDRLPTILKEQGILFTEDHRQLYRVDSGQSLASPVITWATRTWLRKYGSLVVCPILERLWAAEGVLRVAVHPFDFDHAVTVSNIRKVLKRVLKIREQNFTSEIHFPV